MNKPIVRSLLTLVALCALALLPARASAQEWSAAQKDVWKSVEAYWALDAAGNTAGFMEYFHADYSGWSVDNALPADKATVQRFIAHSHKTSKTLLHHIQPVAIKIHGDIAIVHYYWSEIARSEGDKEKARSGRWTDVLKKQGDRWVLVADHGGATPGKND
jgi:ketosteroid isomerase-like protein